MFIKKIIVLLLVLLLIATGISTAIALTEKEQLGKSIFFDMNLSFNQNQSCAACHAPEVGWTGPDKGINAHGAVYEGSIPGRFGNRKPPSSAYAGDSPVLNYDDTNGMWVGGMFWDGRATGSTLGDPLAEQAQGPFLNPLEQALPDATAVVSWVCSSSSGYKDLFLNVWGSAACDEVNTAYEYVARSIAAYERSSEVSSFSSKFDGFWDKANSSGKDVTAIDMRNWWDYRNLGLNSLELKGLALFNDQTKGKCSLCHSLAVAKPDSKPLFTDFTYDNLGVPKNPKNPFYYEPDWNPDGTNWVDYGLGGFLESAGYDQAVYGPELGKMKVPTLRNVDKRPYPGFIKAYSHNGYFKSLYSIVHFYNTRDRLASCDSKRFPLPGFNCWPEPEVIENVNRTELGNLGLSFFEEWFIVEFLKTLSDK